MPRFLNLALLVLNPKLCLVVKIDNSQVPTTKQSLEIRFSPSKLGIPDQQEVLHWVCLVTLFIISVVLVVFPSHTVPHTFLLFMENSNLE